MVCSGDKAPWHGAESAFVAGRAPPPPTGDALGFATAVTTSLAARLSCSDLSWLGSGHVFSFTAMLLALSVGALGIAGFEHWLSEAAVCFSVSPRSTFGGWGGLALGSVFARGGSPSGSGQASSALPSVAPKADSDSSTCLALATTLPGLAVASAFVDELCATRPWLLWHGAAEAEAALLARTGPVRVGEGALPARSSFPAFSR